MRWARLALKPAQTGVPEDKNTSGDSPDVRPRLGALRRERLAVFRAARAADTVGNERKTEPWNLLWFAGCRISEAPVDPVLVLR